MDDFYKEYILDHYRNPRNFGHLERVDATAEDLNPLCGDTIKMELALDGDGRIEDVKFSGRGCAISQASASMLTESVKGMKLEDVARLPQEAVLEPHEVRDARTQGPQERRPRRDRQLARRDALIAAS
jgi:nitrogen fixation NifU-like protein